MGSKCVENRWGEWRRQEGKRKATGDTSLQPWKVAGGLEEGCHKGGSPSKAGPVGLPGAEGVLNPSSANVFNSIIHSSKKKKMTPDVFNYSSYACSTTNPYPAVVYFSNTCFLVYFKHTQVNASFSSFFFTALLFLEMTVLGGGTSSRRRRPEDGTAHESCRDQQQLGTSGEKSVRGGGGGGEGVCTGVSGERPRAKVTEASWAVGRVAIYFCMRRGARSIR